MRPTINSLPNPEAFFHYASMVEALFEEDPLAMGLAIQLPVNELRTYVRRYHQDNVVTTGAKAKMREAYLRNLVSHFVVGAAPGYTFSLN